MCRTGSLTLLAAFVLDHHLVFGSSSNSRVAFTGRDSVESVVVLSADGTTVDGYLASSVDTARPGIFKHNADGIENASFIGNPEIVTKGLALTRDQQTLFAAHDNVVTKYTVIADGDGLINPFEYVMPFGMPNGVCLNDAESILYVTDPGWTVGMSGCTKDTVSTGGLAKVDLGTGVVTTIFTNQADTYSPNGCTVQDELVYFAMAQHGVGIYDTSAEDFASGMTATAPWSRNVEDTQKFDAQCGDGVAFHDDKIYISSWKATGVSDTDGNIYQCDLSAGACALWSQVGPADIDVFGDKLLAPNLMSGEVIIMDLGAEVEDDSGDNPSDDSGEDDSGDNTTDGSSRASPTTAAATVFLALALGLRWLH